MSRMRTYCYKTIALLIAGAFVYVQSMALTCSINHLIDTTGLEHHHQLGHDHHHTDDKIPGNHHHDAGSHKEDEKGCCSDFTQAFLSAFGKSPTIGTDYSFKQLHVEFIPVYSCIYSNDFLRTGFNIHIDPLLPPPKIPDIRVFIRSFQI